MAGSGAGRKALDDVLGTVESGIWRNMTELRRWSESLGDERIGLVVSPLAYIYHYSPTYVAFEQVPPVLPVWEAMAVQMRPMGYSVWTGYLHSEQYGVPQTRKRAYLLAKRDLAWQASPPTPTHSRYYSRTPEKLDAGVLPWVSMAEALGNLVDRPSPTVTGGGGVDRGVGAVRENGPRGDQAFTLVSNYGSGGDPANRGRRMSSEPASTVTSKFDRVKKEAV